MASTSRSSASARKQFVLNGAAPDFHVEIGNVLCPGFTHYGANLDAFVDVLRGGFGTFDDGEEITIIVKNHKKLAHKFLEILQEAENVELRLE